MRIFEKKATSEEVEGLRCTIAQHSVDLSKHYDALCSQKRMIDMLLEYLNLEPVKTITGCGSDTMESVKLCKRVARKIKKDEGEYDD